MVLRASSLNFEQAKPLETFFEASLGGALPDFGLLARTVLRRPQIDLVMTPFGRPTRPL